ncbi:hypothetical protein [Halorussus pelagicus]|uniref:hypothetical protein n=1 Tax=Halorussus pelagicus TaxID=2505977 RepID=UPI000FFBFFA1|nr:hypothetical protein [Halorussus pelagicus]
MNQFDAGDTNLSRSIALDASTVDSVTVTVAVPATRTEEWAVLDSLYTTSKASFRPFLDKASDLQYDSNIDFFDTVRRDAPVSVLTTTHLGKDGSNPERVEAVQSALLVSELTNSETLVLVDGGKTKAEAFVKAIDGIVSEIPPTTHCIRAEQYFPTALLADILASHLAHQITDSSDCTAVTPPSPESKREYADEWGKAYSSLFQSQARYERTPVPTKRGRTVRERIRCWYEGYVAVGNGEYPMTDSLTPVVHSAEKRGFSRLADQLSQI